MKKKEKYVPIFKYFYKICVCKKKKKKLQFEIII